MGRRAAGERAAIQTISVHSVIYANWRRGRRAGGESEGQPLNTLCGVLNDVDDGTRTASGRLTARLVYTSERFVYTSGCRDWWGAKVLIVL